jgi:hypothetical protein
VVGLVFKWCGVDVGVDDDVCCCEYGFDSGGVDIDDSGVMEFRWNEWAEMYMDICRVDQLDKEEDGLVILMNCVVCMAGGSKLEEG